jgi:hypothetical protein
VTRDLATRPSVGEVAIGATMCASAAALTIVAAAVAVVVTGTGDDVRRSLRLSFAGVSHTQSEVLTIALQNARIAGAAFLSAVAVPRLPSRVRTLVDALLATVFVLNAALVGVALGAYGRCLAVCAVAHVPIEFGALAVAGGVYVAARHRPLGVRSLAAAAGLCTVLLVLAAAVETYASGGSQ